MTQTRYRVIFEWGRYEQALREAARRRGWTDEKVRAALQRDRLCTIEVEDLEAQLDWHERLGFQAPTYRSSEG